MRFCVLEVLDDPFVLVIFVMYNFALFLYKFAQDNLLVLTALIQDALDIDTFVLLLGKLVFFKI